MEHFSHEHTLILSKYDNSLADALCYNCENPFFINTDVYHCIHRSITAQNSPCASFFLHKTCANLPMIIQHHLHIEHLLTLKSLNRWAYCKPCNLYVRGWNYECTRRCYFGVCIKCAFLELELNHPSHNHTLTLLPLMALHMCPACGKEGCKDFSYLCKTCFFWIHKSCASAPTNLIRKDHHTDHPLVLAYSLPEEYQRFGVSCRLCPEMVDSFYWLYYCAGCRYFAHVQCALSAAESAKKVNEIDDEVDVDGSDLVHFPLSEDEPYILYQLIQKFAKKFSISTEEKSGKADKISQCRNGHSLILFDDDVQTNTTDKKICDGCVQPLLSPPDSFYGCQDCNFFLHSVCAAELPRKVQHASYPENDLTISNIFYQTSKPLIFYSCNSCGQLCNGISYSDESRRYWVDIACAALPSKIKHSSHRHTLHQLNSSTRFHCRACGFFTTGLLFACEMCDHSLHIKCALKPGKIKHRWDEHHLVLMYPPVKGHPHAFNCELCSDDIDPNYWFYHCSKCDTSFHSRCIDQDVFSNIKYGSIVEDGNLHEHSLQLTGSREMFKCHICDQYKSWFYDYGREPRLRCVPCKISVCILCIITSRKRGARS